VDIQGVKEHAGTPVSDILEYVFRYSTKIAEVMEHPNFWYGITTQLRGARFVATSGVMKRRLKKPEKVLSQEENERQIDIEVTVDRELNVIDSGGVMLLSTKKKRGRRRKKTYQYL
jgi:hypothetical protein